MRLLGLLALLLILRPTIAVAGCTRGCPCGYTCISCLDTCHVGQTSGGSAGITSNPALGVALVMGSLGGFVTALFTFVPAQAACADVEIGGSCGWMAAWWMLMLVSIGLGVGGIAVLAPPSSRGSSSSALSLPLMSGSF